MTCVRVFGNIIKLLSYPFHFVFPKLRFNIPSYSKAKLSNCSEKAIPRTIWQINFSSRSTLAVYANYLFNRLMSLQYDYKFMTNKEGDEFMRNNAPEEVYKAYSKLNDGAAKADLWRMVVLNKFGGIYMDIDATLVWPLESTISDDAESLFIRKNNKDDYTNYFLATTPNSAIFKETIRTIVTNINCTESQKSVYEATGPCVLTKVIGDKSVFWKKRNQVCIQGAFTNEYLQYMDKPGSKWTHKKPGEFINRD